MCRVTAPPAHAAEVDPPHTVVSSTEVSRRSVLRGGVTVGVGLVAVTAVGTACDSGPTPAQITAEALLPLARSAGADAASARALAPRSTDYAAALGVIADQRSQHARALREEISRLDQDIAARLDPSAASSAAPSAGQAPTSPDAPPAGGAAPVADVGSLRDALAGSARAAQDAAIRLRGYSAGLAGSVGASTTTLAEVQLG